MGSLGVITIPFRVPRLEAPEPFEKPLFRSPYLAVVRNRRSLLEKLLNGHLSQTFFIHRSPSYGDWTKVIIPQTGSEGNRCIDTKTDIEGNPCAGTSG
jgi:hypothetical protein